MGELKETFIINLMISQCCFKLDQKLQNLVMIDVTKIWLVRKLGKFLSSLIDKHFPPHHKLHKWFNQKNVKINYSCLPSIISIINANNRRLLYPSPTIGRRTCNCISMSQFSLYQKSLTNILYQTSITPPGKNLKTKVCYGIWEITFKLQYKNHKK